MSARKSADEVKEPWETKEPSLQPDSRQSSIRVFDQLDGFTELEDDISLKNRLTKWWKRYSYHQKIAAQGRGVWDWLALFLPCIGWLSKYSVCPSPPHAMYIVVHGSPCLR